MLVIALWELLLIWSLISVINCTLIALSRPVGHPLPQAGEGLGERGRFDLRSTLFNAGSIEVPPYAKLQIKGRAVYCADDTANKLRHFCFTVVG